MWPVQHAVIDRLAEIFVGRREELRLLSAELQTVRTGHPRVVWIEGESGVGKSALLRQFLARPGAPGVRLVRASGEEGEGGLTYGLLGQVFPPAPGIESAGLRLLARRPPPDTDPLALGAELGDWLRGLQSGGSPVVLAVEDLQWCDGPSARALLFALRRLRAERVLALLTVRAGAPVPHADGWRRLTDEPTFCRRLLLTGLSTPEVRELASALQGEAPPVGAAERLREHTGGNPLHLRALLRELPPEVLRQPVGRLPAPRSLSAAVSAALAGVSSATRSLAEALAVAGGPCRVGLAAAVAGLPDADGALAQLRAIDMVRPAAGPSGDEIAFAHPLLRVAVYQDLAPGRRARLHERIAQLTASLAHRVAAAAGMPDAGLATELETLAVAESAAGDLHAAADHLLSAVQICADGPDRERRVLTAAATLHGAGELARAELLRPLVEACRPGLRRSHVLGRLDLDRGRLASAGRLLEEALAAVPPGADPEEAASATASLAMVRVQQGRLPEAVALARRALAAESLLPWARRLALLALLTSLVALGRRDDALSLADAAVAAAGADAVQSASARALRGAVLAAAADFAAAAPDLTAAVETLWAADRWRESALAYVYLAESRFRLGDWAAAEEQADMAVSLAEDAGYEWHRAAANGVAALILACRGGFGPAESCVRAAAEASAGQPASWGARGHAGLAAAVLARLRGDPARALATVEPLCLPPLVEILDNLGRFYVRAERVEALLALGRLPEAEDALVDLETRVRPGTPLAVDAHRLRGGLEAARGRDGAARAAFEAGLAQCAEGAPFERAQLQLARGRCLRLAGERREAGKALRAARQALGALGAAPWLPSCDAELLACGLRGVPRTGANPLDLTPREMAVARLAAQGLTNREIGAQVYLSHKAVEHHLGQVFAKLGVRSRRHLGAALPPEDPTAPR